MELPSLLDDESTIREWLTDPRGKAVFEPVFQQITVQMGKAMGSGDTEQQPSDAIGMDMVESLMDMPLPSILHFQEALLSVTPEEIVNDLLKQAKG